MKHIIFKIKISCLCLVAGSMMILTASLSWSSVTLPVLQNTSSQPSSTVTPVVGPSVVKPQATEIIINIPAMEVRITHLGLEVLRYPIAVGSPRYQTPIGDRELTEVIWNPSWYPPPSPWAKGAKPTPPGPNNPLGPVKMELGGDIKIHGTTRETSIGSAASHGCMRMKNADAKALGKWIQLNHTNQTAPELFEEYAKVRWKNFFVKLDQPIPVKVVYDLVEMDGPVLKLHQDIYRRVEDKQKMVIEYLEQKGFSAQKIHQAALIKWLEEKNSSTILLKKLLPPLIASNPHPQPDSFELSWIERQRRLRWFSTHPYQ